MNIVQKIATYFIEKADYSTIIQAYYKGKNSGKGIEWKRQSQAMTAKEIKDWKLALMAATDPDNPRRGELMRFYENMLMDLHLSACIENRILPVQCAPFKLVDANDNEDSGAKKLLEKPWYLDLVRLVSNHTFEGTKLLELFELNDKGELKEVAEVPQSNFIPTKGIVLKNEYDEHGVSYKQGVYRDYYVQVGGDYNLGLLNRVAIIVIAKKLGLGSWISYIEKYGVPPIFAITNRMDTNRRDELFEMLENFRMNHFAVLQGDEKIETPQGYNVDAHNTFKSLMDDVANKEMSKYLNGGTGTTDEKSFVGSAEVHERLLKLRHQVDKLVFRFYFNEEIRPRLVKLSPVYAPLENLTFEWDESETLSVGDIIKAIQGLSAYYEFDIEELERITGLPFTGIKNAGPTPPGAVEKERDVFGLEKKKFEPSGSLKFPPLNRDYGDFKFTPDSLIYAGSWDAAAERVAKKLFNGEIKPSDLDRDFVLKTYSALNKSAENGYGAGYYEDELPRILRENLLKFSGAKTNRILEDMEAAKRAGLSEDGYMDYAKKVTDIQMDAWLTTERRNVARSAQMAAEWQDFERDKDIFPNLKNRTMLDDDVRDTHAANEGIVKPVDEWTETPPYDYNCRCWLEQTNEPPTAGRELVNVNPAFANNPGSTGEVFSKQHSYFDMRKSVEQAVWQNTELMKEFMPYGRVVEAGKQSVFINDFTDFDYISQNLNAAQKIAPVLGKNIYLRPHINVRGYKNPEFGIGRAGKLGDLKTFDTGRSSSTYNFVKNSLESAGKQRATYTVMDISASKEATEVMRSSIIRRLYGSFKKGDYKSINESVFIRGENVVKISRKQVLSKDFSPLNQLFQ